MLKRIAAFLLLVMLTLTGCDTTDGAVTTNSTGSSNITSADPVETSAETEQETPMITEETLFTSDFSSNNGGFEAFSGGKFTFSDGKAVYHDREYAWSTPAYDLYPIVKQNGAGTYIVRITVSFECSVSEGKTVNYGTLIRSGNNTENSFIKNNDGNYYARLENESFSYTKDKEYSLIRMFTVKDGDISDGGKWLFCFDMLDTVVEKVTVHAFSVSMATVGRASLSLPQTAVTNRCGSISLISDVAYDSLPLDLIVSAEFTSGDKMLVFNGFWNGGRSFIIRFALPYEGEWAYKVTSTDKENAGLIQSGSLTCTKYKGELDIYKHGFIQTRENTRCFVYADGTPFFYLGDTHWNMPAEEYEEHFKVIVDKRVKQGFTVYQSEPIGAKYNLSDGFTDSDLYGFSLLDEKFDYIANAGLVHANAMLFFTSELANHADKYDDEYLRALTRYWAARYGAYPVLWTLAQECDDDFYFDRGDQKVFDAETNPWKRICAWLSEADTLSQPITAHMEYASSSGSGGINASRSSFRDVTGHSWFGAQYSPSLTGGQDIRLLRDFYNNAGGKPVINYESRYENLWTGNFGARAQGWISFLSGMTGYGYGAADIWLYNGTYDMETTSNDGYEEITPEDKNVKWQQALNFDSVKQLGYMKDFFKSFDWYKLVPSFGAGYITQSTECAVCATVGNDMYVVYFYGKDTKTATLARADNAAYKIQWFNPRTGEYGAEQTVDVQNNKIVLPEKPDSNDWVLTAVKK